MNKTDAKKIILHSNNWSSFESKILNLNENQRGYCFELLVKLYLLTEPIYKHEFSNVWIDSSFESDLPLEIKKELNLLDTDEGVDLVCKKANSEEYVCVQCKYIGTGNNLNRNHLSSSISFCSGTETKLKEIYACSNALEKSRRLKKYTSITYMLGNIWTSLNKESFGLIHNFLNGKTKPKELKPFNPKEHQQIAIDKASEHFENNSRGILIMPCGTGKTITSILIAKELHSKNIFVAVPSLSLVQQTFEDWVKFVISEKLDAKICCICSDEKVSDINYDDFVDSKDYLGFKTLDQTEDIANWLRSPRKVNIIIITYQSSLKLIEVSKSLNFKWDLGIFDEAHNTCGEINNRFSQLIFENNINCKKRMFMTATPKIFFGDKEKKIAMNDVSLFGKEFYLLSFADAIAKYDALIDYEILNLEITKKEIREFLKENEFLTGNEKNKDVIETRYLASSLAIKKARKIGIKKTISFHYRIDKAEQFSKQHNKFTEPQISSMHIRGSYKSKIRKNIIDEFKEKQKSILTNARCLTEGVDITCVDSIIFVDPKKSSKDIVQAVGRGLRKHDEKKKCYIILPVIYEDGKIISKDSYNNIVTILQEMSQTDSRINDIILDELKERTSGDSSEIIPVPKEIFCISFKEFEKSMLLKILKKTRININLTEEIILKFADEFNQDKGFYPNYASHKLEHHPYSWAYIDSCLAKGFRTLKGGSTLHKFLVENKRVEAYKPSKNTITVKEILGVIEAYVKKYKKYPTYNSGKVNIDYSKNITKKTTWGSLHQILSKGRYGLNKITLQNLIAEKFGVRTGKIRWNDVKITEKEVLKACEKWKEENKSYPKYNSGKIGKRLTKNILKDDVWGSIDFALANGDIKSRAKSIAHLLEIKGLRKRIISHSNLKITQEDVEAEIIKFHKKNGRYPKRSDDFITRWGLKWVTLTSAFDDGRHGLKIKYSKLMSKFSGRKIRGEKFSYKDIKLAVRKFFKLKSKLPENKDEILGYKVVNISASTIHLGFSDFKDKMTVPQLIINEFGLKVISEETLGPILKKIWDKSGVIPKYGDTISEDIIATTWGIVNDALVNKKKENFLIKTKAKNLAELLCNYCKKISDCSESEILSAKDISKILNIKLYRAVRKINKAKINYVSLQYNGHSMGPGRIQKLYKKSDLEKVRKTKVDA